VLSGTVDSIKGLFLTKASKAVLGSDFLNDLHDDQVLVNLSSVHAIKGGKFVLVRGDFTVTSLKGDSHLPALFLDFLHAQESRVGKRERGHVMVTHLLVTRSDLTHDGTASKLKIRAAVELVTGDKEL
jgi:hypothetical protein